LAKSFTASDSAGSPPRVKQAIAQAIALRFCWTLLLPLAKVGLHDPAECML